MSNNIFIKDIFQAMNAVYKELHEDKIFLEAQCTGCGKCCDFHSSGHQLYLSFLEALYMIEEAERQGWSGDFIQPLSEGLCPYQMNNTCLNRNGRAIGCRVYFCSQNTDNMQDLSNLMISKLKHLSQHYNFPWVYGELSIMLPAAQKFISKMKTNDILLDNLDEEIDGLFED